MAVSAALLTCVVSLAFASGSVDAHISCARNRNHRRLVVEGAFMHRFGGGLLSRAAGRLAPVHPSNLLPTPPAPARMSRKRPMPASSAAMRSTVVLKQTNANEGRRDEDPYRPLVIVLAGPTAVGKSDVAAELCSPDAASDISRGHRSSHRARRSRAGESGIERGTASRGHVVSADSVQAYRGVDVGANKPSPEERRRTPHHLVDVVDPPKESKAASYNAADWMRDARYVIRRLTSRDGVGGDAGDDEEEEDVDLDDDASLRRERIEDALSQSLRVPGGDNSHAERPILPVVVGGTMMYLQWLVHGRPDAVRPTDEAAERAAKEVDRYKAEAKRAASPKASEAVMDSSDEDATDVADAAAWNAASTYASSLGPIFAERVAKLPGRDWYRLRRLLEVAYTISSKKKASLEEAADKTEEEILRDLTDRELYTGIRSGSLPDLGYDVRCFFLCPDERMTHFHTADERCERMLLRGLLVETADLHASGGLPDGSQVNRAIGYRQALEYLKRKGAKRNDRVAFVAFLDDFATATRQYAKKQMQWFRRDVEFAFVPVKMECEKPKRASGAAKIIADMCKMSRRDFDLELSSGNGESESHERLSLSAQTKLDNERQGKKMKFFISKRTRLIEGSDAFSAALKEADEWTKKVQGLGEEF